MAKRLSYWILLYTCLLMASNLSVTICSASVRPNDFKKSYSFRGNLAIILLKVESVAK